MALTPDDLLTKRFDETRFRDGYDQDEVDDFLDLVANDWRAVIAERDALLEENAKLKAQLEDGGQSAPAEPAPAAPIASAPAAPAAAEEPVTEEQQDGYRPSADSSASLLAMAQKLHDQHVEEGETRRAELIAEGESKRDELITSATSEAEQIEANAVVRSDELDKDFEQKKIDLERQRTDLQDKIDELKSFERDYRLRLRGYIESQLRDLDRTSSLGKVAGSDDQS